MIVIVVIVVVVMLRILWTVVVMIQLQLLFHSSSSPMVLVGGAAGTGTPLIHPSVCVCYARRSGTSKESFIFVLARNIPVLDGNELRHGTRHPVVDEYIIYFSYFYILLFLIHRISIHHNITRYKIIPTFIYIYIYIYIHHIIK